MEGSGSGADATGSMGFWAHVDELRATIVRCVVVVALLAVAVFAFAPWIFDNIILAPCSGDFVLYRWLGGVSGSLPWGADGDAGAAGYAVSLVNINLASQFFIHVSLSLWLAVILSVPWILYQLWLFVMPGLYAAERSGVRSAFLAGCVMFYIGLAAGYFVVFPVTLRFLAEYQLSASIPNHITLDSYMDNFVCLNLVMGLLFELPMLTWLSGRLGLISRRQLVKYRRHAVVALLVVAAVITPTGDPFTLFIVFLPLYLLWETGILFVRC